MGTERTPLRGVADLASEPFGSRRERSERLPTLDQRHHHPRRPQARPADEAADGKPRRRRFGRETRQTSFEGDQALPFGRREEAQGEMEIQRIDQGEPPSSEPMRHLQARESGQFFRHRKFQRNAIEAARHRVMLAAFRGEAIMRLSFLGAAGEVTGSSLLLETHRGSLLVDCGLFQGGAEERRRNAARFPFDPRALGAVVLTHAHLDHVGRLPYLLRAGFRGRIHAHQATAALAGILLRDAYELMRADLEKENRARLRRGLAPLPAPYDRADLEAVLERFSTHAYRDPFAPLPGISVEMRDAGHILGSASLRIAWRQDDRERVLAVSGDLGPFAAPLMCDPQPIEDADWLVLESTYGNRRHRSRSETLDELGGIFVRAAEQGGAVLIPAFAVGRSQEILWWLGEHRERWGIARFRIFLDSPMAVAVGEVYDRFVTLLDHEAQRRWRGPSHPLRLPNLRLVTRSEDSIAINQVAGPLIVIAGSGMCNGGRILHHLRHRLWRENTELVFVGYQAEGTLGRRLVEGAQYVSIFGERIRVRARIHTVGGLSAHGDREDLCRWYQALTKRPPVWLVHGEDAARRGLAEALGERFGAKADQPNRGESILLG